MQSGKLQGKVAIVTGGGLGFGEGIVTKFVQEGAKVMLMDVTANRSEDDIGMAPWTSKVVCELKVPRVSIATYILLLKE